MANQGGSHTQHGKAGQPGGKDQDAQHASGAKRDQSREMPSKGSSGSSDMKNNDHKGKKDH